MKKFLILFLVICNALQLAANTANPDIEAANKSL